MFRAASDDDIEAYSDTVTCFIRKCIDDVVPTKTIRIYPNQKPWINSDVRSALSARTSAFKSGNTDDRKQTSYDLRRSIKAAKQTYKNKVEEHFNNNNPRSMWQGINNITGFKGINQLLWTLTPLYRTSSTLFMLGSRLITPHTRAVVLESGLGLESGLETFFYRLGLVLDSLVFGLGLVSDLVIGLAKCSSWSRPSPAIYAFFSLSKQNH